MPTDDTDPTDHSFSRRTFLKASGAVAGAGLLGAGLSGSASAHSGLHAAFADPRVREAATVWARGYRGRPDRTAAVNDSGIDVDHPDLGGWNGVTAVPKELGDGDAVPEVLLAGPDELAARAEHREAVLDEPETATAVLGPGTTVEGSRTVVAEFTPPTGEGVVDMDATLSWTPENVPLPDPVPVLDSAGEDQSFSVQLNVGGEDDPEWVTLQTVDTGSNPEELTNVTVVPGERHRFVAGQFANVAAQGEVEWNYFGYADDALEPGGTPVTFDAKTVGWFDAGSRYGSLDAPADPDGHGSHVSGIIAGTGEASAVDPGRLTKDDPRAVLTAGDALTYEVSARAGTGVFGVATGEGVEVLVEAPDGRTLRTSGAVPALGNKEALPVDDALVDHPTVHESGEATYTVVVRPVEGEAVSTGRVEEVRAGAFLPPDETAGDREAGDPSLHSGLAPDAGLVGLQGLSGPAAALGLYADRMAPLFNVRTVNMSWGGLVPGGGTVGGGGTQRAVKDIAEGGVLTVAAAGNTYGTVNTAPAIADEAVSVAATNYVDGVTVYSDGGAQAQDEDGEGTYGKPDVCAPGGSYEAGARSVRANSDGDYVNYPGTSMASPYVCGTATLLAQAMEEDAPESIRLPSPKALHNRDSGGDATYTAEDRLAHVMRLKSVLLGTASSTAFTAAPYHRHAVRYVHDGRDTYQGYGRVNPDAAVDAVTYDLFDDDRLAAGPDVHPTGTAANRTVEATRTGAVGLDVPGDARAVAGYVEAPDGTLDVSVSFSHYAGGNKGMTKGSPWLDLFVYDAENPTAHGEPTTVASTQAPQGSGSVSVGVSTGEGADSRTYLVVAKLVNVPGVVNGYDVQAHLNLGLSFTRADLPAFTASGTRTDDGSTFTAGQTNHVTVTLTGASGLEDAPDDTTVRITDVVPPSWERAGVGDGSGRVADDRVDLGTTTLGTVRAAGEGVTREYFVEAPSATGPYGFGAARVELVDDVDGVGNDAADFGGAEVNYVVGQSTNAADASDAGSTADAADAGDAAGTTVEGTTPDSTAAVGTGGATLDDASTTVDGADVP